MKNSQVWCTNLPTNYLPAQSPIRQKVNETKNIFDLAFQQVAWEIHPLIIPFLTPIEVRKKQTSLQVTIAPVNHNRLNQSKATQIAHTILGNAYKDKNDPTLANQDFGNDACILVGCNDVLLNNHNKTNRIGLKDLQPNDEEQKYHVYRYLFLPDVNRFMRHLYSNEFHDFLKLDATTTEGQMLVAEYFGVSDMWMSGKKTNTVRGYYDLLCMVKAFSDKDIIWISFWEGMHRHAAIIMTLLCTNITYNSNNCYKPRTLEKDAFQDYIKGFTDPGPEPLQLIQNIFDGNSNARLLRTVMSVMAYTPKMRETAIDKLFEAVRAQSKHILENKLSSAARTFYPFL
jgi:hypothetical protein